MRRVLALGCCAAYLVFGFVAGAAHVHESADHHEATGGLHLDHAHLGESAGHGPEGHAGHGSPDEGDARVDARHVAHHAGDELYLTSTALRTFDSSLRPMPAAVSVGAAIGSPRAGSEREEPTPEPVRGPPETGLSQPRAPPV